MLVLSRKQAERLRLGNDIVVTVLRIGGDKVRLGIEAPTDVVILRDELQPFDESPDDGDQQATEVADRDDSAVADRDDSLGNSASARDSKRRRLIGPKLKRSRRRPPKREAISGSASA